MFALATVIGRTMDKYNLFYGIKACRREYAVTFLGSGLIFFVLAYLLFGYIENSKPAKKSSSEILSFLFDRKPFLIPFCAFIISWIPYLICYPGSPCGDFWSQIFQSFGVIPLDNNYPLFSTLVYGAVMKFGKAVGSDNIAVFILTVSQTIMMASLFAWIIYLLRKIPHPARLVLFLIFAFSPSVALYTIYVAKDMVYAFWIAVFTVFLFLMIRNGRLTRPETTGFLIASAMCILWRNNGIHTLVPTLFVMLFVKSVSRKQVAASFITVLVVYFAIHKVVMPAYNIPEGSITEMLSLPFQQTARTVKYHGKKIPNDEREIIDKILDYDNLAENYCPYRADGVKGEPMKVGSQKQPTSKELKSYLRVWFKQTRKYPSTAFAATANNTYAYFAPGKKKANLHKLLVTSPEIRMEHYDIDRNKYSSNFTLPDNSIYAKTVSYLPKVNGETFILRNFTGVSFFTWLMIAACFFMIKRRAYKYLLVALPSLITLLVCIASPVNGESRYALPYMFCAPFLLGICFLLNGNDE